MIIKDLFILFYSFKILKMVDKRPCTYCMYNKPEHNPLMDKMDKMTEKKKNPKKISNKKMFETKKEKTKSKSN